MHRRGGRPVGLHQLADMDGGIDHVVRRRISRQGVAHPPAPPRPIYSLQPVLADRIDRPAARVEAEPTGEYAMTSRAAKEYRYEKLTWPEINDAIEMGKV